MIAILEWFFWWKILIILAYSRITTTTTTKRSPLSIPMQIIVEKWNLYQPTWIIVYFNFMLQNFSYKFAYMVCPNLTLIFFNVTPPPQIWQRNRKVHRSNCLDANFHNTSDINLRANYMYKLKILSFFFFFLMKKNLFLIINGAYEINTFFSYTTNIQVIKSHVLCHVVFNAFNIRNESEMYFIFCQFLIWHSIQCLGNVWIRNHFIPCLKSPALYTMPRHSIEYQTSNHIKKKDT